MPTATPKAITEQILTFCRQLIESGDPLFLKITPEDGCVPGDCFQNVRRKADRLGGRIVHGWAIWEWPRVMIEAEHHAVYEPPGGGAWSDPTPHGTDEITRRLFLPDESAIYDFEHEGVLRDNVRMALSEDPLIQKFFAAAAERVKILNSIPGIGMVSVDEPTAMRLKVLDRERLRLTYEIGMKYTSQNARCLCGSGEKFKRCHGQSQQGRRIK